MTIKYKRLKWLFLIISILLNVTPLVSYTLIGLFEATLIIQKATLSMTVFVVLIMSIISWINKITLRSKLWILLIGLYIALQNILTPLILIAVCQIIDELIINPLYKRYSKLQNIHKEIDKRL